MFTAHCTLLLLIKFFNRLLWICLTEGKPFFSFCIIKKKTGKTLARLLCAIINKPLTNLRYVIKYLSMLEILFLIMKLEVFLLTTNIKLIKSNIRTNNESRATLYQISLHNDHSSTFTFVMSFLFIFCLHAAAALSAKRSWYSGGTKETYAW